MDLQPAQLKRLALEMRLLTEHAQATPGFVIQKWGVTPAGEVCLSFHLELLVGTFNGLLVYPDLFPDMPAYVKPQRDGESWSSHQYLGAGVLCLQYGPDNWQPSITGVDLVRSANLLLWNDLLRAVVPGAPAVITRHYETLGQNVRFDNHRFVVTAGLREAIVAAEGASEAGRPIALKAGLMFLSGQSVAVATMLGGNVSVADVPAAVAEEASERSGWLVRVSSVAEAGKPEGSADLIRALSAAWPWPEELDGEMRLLVLHDENGALRVFSMSGGADARFSELRVLDFGTLAQARLPAQFEKLTGVTVAVVGLGSVGSKVAVSLARAGVRRFLLIDDDVLAPCNLVRNELNWLDVGFEKVNTVARELNRIAPGVEVKVRSLRIAGQENPLVAVRLATDLVDCNLVVDATANAQVFVTLAALCKRAKVALMWGELFGGGGGGLMARSRPGLDADPLSIRGHLLGVMAQMSPAPEGPANRYGVEVDGHVYVASDADVSALAASMTQFTLDALCADGESAYPVAAYLIGFRKFWEFKQPFDTIPIDCTGAFRPETTGEALTPEDTAQLGELVRALQASTNAAGNRPA